MIELGNMPSGWKIAKIKDILSIRDERTVNGGEFPLCSLTIEEGVIEKPERYVREFLVKSKDKKYKKVYFNDIVFNPMNLRWGAIALSKLEKVGIVSPVYNVLFSKGIVDVDYLTYLLKSKFMIQTYNKFAQGTLIERTGVSLKEFIDFPVPIPTKREQQKIARIFGTIDSTTEKTKSIIKQIELVKQGIMQILFTEGFGHSKFKQTDIGEIPANWEVVSLGDIISDLMSGVSVKCTEKPKSQGELGVLKTSSVTAGVFKPEENKTILPNEIQRANVSPMKDHIIICRKNTPELVGSSAFIERDYPDLFLPDLLWQIVIKDKFRVYPLWLSLLLSSSSMKNRISQLATGSTISMRNISKNSFLGLKIALPPYEEQLFITQSLSSLTNLSKKETQYVRQLETTKEALLHVLLTEKVSVNVNKPSEVSV